MPLPAAHPAPSTARPTPPGYYVPLPRPLLQTLRDTPLAIGVYALIARVFRATNTPVPLSPADIARYDPAVSRQAAGRALVRLRALGYLEKAPSGGPRNAYRPTWGVVGGAVRPWNPEAPILGRPPHIRHVSLPQELLDTCLGRLEPHARRGAYITRYLTAPLLTLAAVGAYALAQAGYRVESEALQRLGLLHDGHILPLPAREELLALASQRRLFEAESPVALSEAGWARLGLPAPPPPGAGGSPLLFVPAERLGDRLGHPIGSPAEPTQHVSASRRPRGRAAPPAAGSHGDSCAEGREESTPQPPGSPQTRAGGGGMAAPAPAGPDRPTAAPADGEAPAPSPASARLLALGVRRDVAQILAGRPLAQVERVIAQARARQGVRDLAAWVVAALRNLPADEPPAAPPPRVSDLAILTHLGLTNAERERWLRRFRAADPAGRPAVLAQFHQEHPNGTVA